MHLLLRSCIVRLGTGTFYMFLVCTAPSANVAALSIATDDQGALTRSKPSENRQTEILAADIADLIRSGFTTKTQVSIPVQAERATSDVPLPADPFHPSNAQTTTGAPFAITSFIPARRCANCHEDTYIFWSESLHRNAGREPFYDESVAILRRTRPVEFTRHCEGCHLPVALLSGALKTGSKVPHTLDDEGVTCSVCHSIVETRLDGTGSYTIAEPALLLTKNGVRIKDASDADIFSDLESHRRAVMRPLLKTPEFCAVCHKSSITPDLSGYEYMQRGFDVYDEWQQSSFSLESAGSASSSVQRADCQTCHMPRVSSTQDHAAQNNTIASHRWPGANTAVPHFYGFTPQFETTKNFLQSGIVGIDIFSVENRRSGERLQGLNSAGPNRLALSPGDRLSIEAILSSQGIGHSFPPELRDLSEAWVDVEVSDKFGNVLFRRGAIETDGQLDVRAHAYRQVLVDRDAQPILRHEVWQAIARLCDGRLPIGSPELLQMQFPVPSSVASDGELRVRVSVRYRRFNQAYSDYVSSQRGLNLENPTVTVVEQNITINGEESGPADERNAVKRWQRYARALVGLKDPRAVDALNRAMSLAPADSSITVDLAGAELTTASTIPRKEQARRALALLEPVFAANAASPRARYLKTVALLQEGKTAPAIGELQLLEADFPRDREVHQRLGVALAAQHSWEEARQQFETVIQIDPLDGDAYEQLINIAVQEGKPDLARNYEERYRVLSRIKSTSVDGPCDHLQ